MLFDIPYIANWYKIGERRQMLTDRNTVRENNTQQDFDHKVGMKVLIDHKSQVYTNGTIKVQHGAKSERINILRVNPFHKNIEE
jgi:hypothetical protein